MNARKYLKWYRHFRAHRQDPETARATALAWTADEAEIQSHRAHYTGYWKPYPTEAPETQPSATQPPPRKRRRSTPSQPTLF